MTTSIVLPPPTAPSLGTQTSERQREYTDTERIAALAHYAETGSLQGTASALGVPYTTLRNWLEHDWASDYVVELRQAVRERYANDYVRLIGAAIGQMEERLRHGDPHILKNGSMVFAPIKFRELVLGMAVCVDKHALLTGNMPSTRPVDRALAALSAKLLDTYRIPSPAAPVDPESHLG